VNEKGWPHFEQKPSVRPGASSRLRPTGSSHTAQKRLCSATTASVNTALAGSCSGIDGISINPAPRRLRADDVVFAVVRREPRADVLVVADGVDVPDGVDDAGATGVVTAPESRSVLTFTPVRVQ
jgi:hypothetical protein